MDSNLAALECFAMKSRSAKMIDSYPKKCNALTKSKGATTNYEYRAVHAYAIRLMLLYIFV